MNADRFLEIIATRLSRSRGSPPSARDAGAIPRELEPSGEARLARAALADRFSVELGQVGGTVLRARTLAEAHDHLLSLIESSGAMEIVSWSRAEFAAWPLERLWSSERCASWEGGTENDAATFRARCAAAHVGLTTADFAVANSGSLVLFSGITRPRAVSLLPAMHVALLRCDQLVASAGGALAHIRARAVKPSSALFITGPSRTSDIENDLTIGVHGPAAVSVILLDEA